MLENDTQDVALDNNESEQDTDTQVDTKVNTRDQGTDRAKELEAELAKWKRIAQRNAKQAEKPRDESGLVEKTYLRAAGISAEDEVELAITTAKKWDMPLDKLVDDEDFQAKLSKLRTRRANEAATSNVKGNTTGSRATESADYWIAKGAPPTPDQVPDRKTRTEIIRAMLSHSKGPTGKFYNS